MPSSSNNGNGRMMFSKTPGFRQAMDLIDNQVEWHPDSNVDFRFNDNIICENPRRAHKKYANVFSIRMAID
jgi:hypothetical protein